MGKKRHNSKRADYNTNFFFTFGIGAGLLSHFVCLIRARDENILKEKCQCINLRGRAEKPVSGIAKRTFGLAQLHGDEPRETLQSLCQKVSMALITTGVEVGSSDF